MPPDKTSINKLNAKQVDKLKGKLVEVRRAGAAPIFVEVKANDSIEDCLVKADVPIADRELKVEAMKDNSRKWQSVELSAKASEYQKVVVTTKVRGSI